MEEPETETIVEERQELMVSPTGDSEPRFRRAYFLKPTYKGPDFKLPSLPPASLAPHFDTGRKPPNVNFIGWQNPSAEWKSWVAHMEDKYHSVWKKAGIFEAIKSSTCIVHKDTDLVIAIAETWSSDTNTFVFPWGEATVSLEDVIVLGGYSVLGDSPVFGYSVDSRELSETETKLREARTELGRKPARKACQIGWMRMFMFSGSDIEHEGFLSFWLERFVLRESKSILRAKVFQVAIRLARGERLALAPAVLASIYRDLSLLKAAIVANSQLGRNENDGYDTLAVTLWSPFHLVQLWIWERFQAIRPRPNVIKNGEPRSALWDNVKGVQIENVRRVLDSAGETFCWRPYARVTDGSQFYEFYKENEEWVDVESNDDLLSFSLCLRVAKLVGIDCLEQYLPHRVAMQFGMDQDVPDCVSPSNEGPELAWLNYIRPFNNSRLHFSSRLFESRVTCRYLDWWKKSVVSLPEPKDLINNAIRRKRSFIERSRQFPQVSIRKEVDVDADAPPGFSLKCKMAKIEDIIDRSIDIDADFPPKCENPKIKDMLTVKRQHIDADVPPGFPPKCENPKSKDIFTVKREHIDSDVPPCLVTNCEIAKIKDSGEDVKPIIEDIRKTCVSDEQFIATGHVSGQAKSLSSVNANYATPEKPADDTMEVNSAIFGSVGAVGHTLDIKPQIANDRGATTSKSELKFMAAASALEARLSIVKRAIVERRSAGFRFKRKL